MSITDCILVSLDFQENEDTAILVVGRQVNGNVTVINAYEGKQALELYSRLIPPSERMAKGFIQGGMRNE